MTKKKQIPKEIMSLTSQTVDTKDYILTAGVYARPQSLDKPVMTFLEIDKYADKGKHTNILTGMMAKYSGLPRFSKRNSESPNLISLINTDAELFHDASWKEIMPNSHISFTPEEIKKGIKERNPYVNCLLKERPFSPQIFKDSHLEFMIKFLLGESLTQGEFIDFTKRYTGKENETSLTFEEAQERYQKERNLRKIMVGCH